MPTFAGMIASAPRLRRSVIDDVTGAPVVDTAPTGEVVTRGQVLPLGVTDGGRLTLAVPGAVLSTLGAAQFPGQVLRGEKGIFDPATGHVSEEAMEAANGIAGLAMTGSMPFKAPRGALRSFGGAAAEHADDPFASLEAALSKGMQEAEPEVRAGPRLLDPNAKSWDLYHGSTPGQDFARFDPTKSGNPHEQAVFFAPGTEAANGYATGTGAGAEAGARVFRATVDPGKTGVFDLAHLAETDPAFNARARAITVEGSGAAHGPLWDQHMEGFQASRAQDSAIAKQIADMGLPPDPTFGTRISYGHGHIGAAIERAKAQGLDTAILRGLVEHGGDDQVIALTPGRVRSYYDPDHVLYSGGPGGAAVAGASVPQSSEAKASMSDDPWAAFRTAKADPAPADADPWAAFRPKVAETVPDRATERPSASTKEAPTVDGLAPAEASGLGPGEDAAAVGRGIINGVPVIGPYLLSGVNRGAAAMRALSNGTTFPEELKKVEAFGDRISKENPWSSTGGELLGGVVGTAPLVAAAPAAFGAGAGPLLARAGAAAASGGALGAADSAVRSDGDAHEAWKGAALGAGLGAAAPVVGAGIGRVVGALGSRGRVTGHVAEALEGISEKDLEAAQVLMDRSRALPGGGVPLSLDEALNAVTGGQAGQASRLARVIGNSPGEGGRLMSEFYAGRPASVDNVGKAAFDRVAPVNLDPTGVGFDAQDAARAGLAQTAEGQVLARARAAQAERITPEQAGQAMQGDLGGVRDLREAARSSRANVDYQLAREAPDNVGIDRTVTVERPGEPVLQTLDTPPARGPEFQPPPDGPATIGSLAPQRPTAPQNAGARGSSLARFIAENGGIGLERGDVKAAGLDRLRQPGVANLVRQDGKGIDDFWRERLIEEGYLPPDRDGGMARNIHDELINLLEEEAKGRKTFAYDYLGRDDLNGFGAMKDEFSNAASQATNDVREALRGADVDPGTVHKDIIDRAAAALMRGDEKDPLAAYERVVMASREPAPRPTSRMVPTTVTEEISAPRYGQANPQPAIDALDRQIRTAKGDVRASLEGIRRDFFEHGTDPVSGVRETDLSVEGLLHLRERVDQHITAAREVGDRTKARDLQIVRASLDRQLKTVPEVATADANFARNSAPLAPFERPNAPLNRATDRVDVPGDQPGPFRTPAEQVPEIFAGPTALREALANGGAATREAAERRLSTQILDAVTDARGDVSADALRKSMREHADVLDQMPIVRDRLSGLVLAREGMARVEASPLGRIAERPDVKSAVKALFPANPLPNSQAEIRAGVEGLARNNPRAARDLVRIYMEGVFSEATQDLRGVAQQYGGAGFASAVRGNGQQRHNLEAAIRALPDGETLWTGLDRMLTALEATGYRPQKGSDTAFNSAIQARLREGTGTIGQAISDVVSGAAAGATVGGPKGAVGGAVVGLRKGGKEILQERRVRRDSEAIARILTDPKAIPMLRSLSRQEPGSRSAALLTTKLLQIGSRSAVSAAQPSPAGR